MTPYYSTEFWVVVLSASFLLIGGFALFARWCMHSPAVSEAKLDALHVGMSNSDVTSLLGRPRHKEAGDKGEEFWFYGAQWKRHLLIVEFNGTKTVREFVHGIPRQTRARKAPPGA